MQSGFDDGVGKPEHHRDVGAWPGRQPGAVQKLGGIGPQRGDRDEIHAGGPGSSLGAGRRVRAQTTVVDLHIAQGQAAEGDHERAVFGDLVECRRRVHRGLPTAGHPAQQHGDRGGRVGVDGAGVATGHVQEAMQLRLRMVEPAGRPPAVGTAEDGAVAVLSTAPARSRRRPISSPSPSPPAT